MKYIFCAMFGYILGTINFAYILGRVKGFASYLGMILAFDWKFFLIIGVSIIIITVVTDYIALATLTTVVVYPVYLIFTRIEASVPVIIAVASIIMIFKHIGNIKKLYPVRKLVLEALK